MTATHGEKREEESGPGGDVGGEQVVDVDSSLKKKIVSAKHFKKTVSAKSTNQVKKTTDLRSKNKIKKEEDGQHKKGNEGLEPGVKS